MNARILCGWLCLGLCTAACLPDRLTPAQLSTKTLAQSDTSTPADATATETVAGPGCGNGAIDDSEECDDKGMGVCTGCVSCKRRRVFNVVDANAVVLVANSKGFDAALADSKDGFSIEMWFNPARLPGADAINAFAVVGTLSDTKAPAFFFGVKRDQDKNVMFPTCGYTYVQALQPQTVFAQGADPVAVGAWHHLRCAVAKGGKLTLSLDGGPLRESTGLVTKVVGKSLFNGGATLGMGAIALEKDKKPNEYYLGLLDELRIVAGPSADDFSSFKLRYNGTELGTQILYHMDMQDAAKGFTDSTANGLGASSVAGQPLIFATDSCYGLAIDAAQCKVAAPWCH